MYSPKLSLPPEIQLVARASAKNEESNVEIETLTEALTSISAEDDITSLSTNLKEFIPKILKVDHENKKLKATNALLEEEISKYKALQRSAETRTKVGNDCYQTKKEYEFQYGDSSRRQQEEFVKMKRQLKRVIDANQAWSTYSNDQVNKHLRQLQVNDGTVKELQDKVICIRADSSSTERQLKARITELESHLKDFMDKFEEIQTENNSIMIRNQQLEDEQKKVRKLAKGLIKEKEDLKKEAEILKEKVEQLSSAHTKEDVTQTTEESNNGTESDNNTNLSHPLRNVESAMDNECLTTKTRETPDSGISTSTGSPAVSKDGTSIIPEKTNVPILEEQVKQFKEDVFRERQDRERVLDELDELKKELENTKLLLYQQSESAAKEKSKTVLPRFTSKEKLQKEKKIAVHHGAVFQYMGSDEVTHLQTKRTHRDVRRNIYEKEREEGNHLDHEIND